MDRPHEWTHTNLHTRGLHVSPAGHADNVFIDIPPGRDHHYENLFRNPQSIPPRLPSPARR